MFSFWQKKKEKPVAFATSCWENNWQDLLQEEKLKTKISYHTYPFSQKILIINNVKNPQQVEKKAKELRCFTDIFFAEEYISSILSFFSLKRESFRAYDVRKEYQVSDDWIFYNALAPLAAIYFCPSPYLLYTTSDVWLKKPVRWIEKALFWMEKKPEYKVANLLWNEKASEAKKESFQKKGDFWVSKKGFSDQMFLIKTKDFQQKIYSEIREDASHFPRGDVFEKRVYSYMKNHGWLRLIYRKGSYFHS